MQEYIANKHLQEQVIPFFRNLNPSFEHYKENFEIAFVLQHHLNVVVFIKFVPSNTFTDLPTLEDSFQDVRSKPRISTGEWVVETIFEIEFNRIHEIMTLISHHKNSPVSFLKSEIKK